MTRATPMTEPQDVLAETNRLMEWLRREDNRLEDIFGLWVQGKKGDRWVAETLLSEGHIAALVRTPEMLDVERPTTERAAIAADRTWASGYSAGRAAALRAASPAPDPGAADWWHLLGWLDLPDGATLGEVEAAALGLGRHQGQAPCRDEEHVLRPDPP